MAIPDFPPDLAKLGPSPGQYEASPHSDSIHFTPDSGPSITRKRSGRTGMRYSVSYTLNAEQFKAFRRFYEGILDSGRKPFYWTEPFTNDKVAVRISPDSLRYTPIGPLVMTAAFELEEVSR